MIRSILLQAQPEGNQWSSVILMLGIVLVFYLFMIRPQQKKAKNQKKFIEETKKGDHIVTVGGIHGRIAEQDNDTFLLETEKGCKIKFNKSAIAMDATKSFHSKK